MAQEISDTYEEKGIFYCGGYIGGSILGTKGIDKAFKSARMMSGTGKLYRRMSKLDDVDDLIPRLKSLEDILSPDDIAAYKKFLQNESRAGLTQEELQAIQRVDDYLALDQADFDDLLRMKGKWGESGRKAFSYTDYENIYQSSIHNPDAEKVMLGKYDDGGPTSYITRAGDDYTYFSIDNWNAIKVKYNFSDDDMFKLFNEAFLDDGINEGKIFQFSHNPIGDQGALGKEYQYLLDNNYRWNPETMTMSP